jgi:hypothetical protein
MHAEFSDIFYIYFALSWLFKYLSMMSEFIKGYSANVKMFQKNFVLIFDTITSSLVQILFQIYIHIML